jgi:hypothetical protein
VQTLVQEEHQQVLSYVNIISGGSISSTDLLQLRIHQLFQRSHQHHPHQKLPLQVQGQAPGQAPMLVLLEHHQRSRRPRSSLPEPLLVEIRQWGLVMSQLDIVLIMAHHVCHTDLQGQEVDLMMIQLVSLLHWVLSVSLPARFVSLAKGQSLRRSIVLNSL